MIPCIIKIKATNKRPRHWAYTFLMDNMTNSGGIDTTFALKRRDPHLFLGRPNMVWFGQCPGNTLTGNLSGKSHNRCKKMIALSPLSGEQGSQLLDARKYASRSLGNFTIQIDQCAASVIRWHPAAPVPAITINDLLNTLFTVGSRTWNKQQ